MSQDRETVQSTGDSQPSNSKENQQVPVIKNWQVTQRAVVFPWRCDQFGHMNVRWYSHHFDDASFHLWAMNKIGNKMMEAQGVHTVVASSKIDFVQELLAGELFEIHSAFTYIGNKSVAYLQKIFDTETGTLHAVQSAVEVFFDPTTRKSVPVPSAFRDVIETILIDPDPQ